MDQDPWNQPLPPDIILGGVKRFIHPLPDPGQSWAVSGGSDSSPALEVKSRRDNQPGEIILQAEYCAGSLNNLSPGEISQSAILDHMSWDWIEFHYRPLQELEVEVINWVPDPRVICGLHHIQNNHSQPREITLKLTCQDEKGKSGIHISNETFQGREILSGGSKNRSLVLFVTGSMATSRGPSNQLITKTSLEPGGKTVIRWILVYCYSDNDVHSYLEEIINLDWDGEIARRKILLSHQLQIKTGNADWDFSLAFSQRQARLILNRLFLQANSRSPADLPLNPLQAWQLFLALAPLESSRLEWLLKAALGKNLDEGSNIPLGAELLWRAHQVGISQDLLNEFLPAIEKNLETWFLKEFDKDGDGIPEEPRGNIFQLEHNIRQEGGWRMQSYQSDAILETPGFVALLQNEICQLQKLQGMTPGISINSKLNERNKALEEFVLDSWQESTSRFRTREYQSHLSEEEYSLPDQVQNGWNILRVKLPFPSRLKLLISRASENHLAENLQVTLQGTDWKGSYRIEELTSQDMLWQEWGGWSTTRSIFSQLDYCVVGGLARNQILQIKTPGSDMQNLSLLLPLWLDNLPAEIEEKILTRSLTKPASFWSDFGLKSYPSLADSPVELPLNLLVTQGLLRSGHTSLAGEIFARWLDTISTNLRRKGCLYSAWDSKTGSGLGKTNHLESTLPIGLLLDLLGVKFLISGEIILEERNPFIYPVQLKYKGVKITLQEGETVLYRVGGDSTSLPRGERTVIHL
jgi:hypothetical protein